MASRFRCCGLLTTSPRTQRVGTRLRTLRLPRPSTLWASSTARALASPSSRLCAVVSRLSPTCPTRTTSTRASSPTSWASRPSRCSPRLTLSYLPCMDLISTQSDFDIFYKALARERGRLHLGARHCIISTALFRWEGNTRHVVLGRAACDERQAGMLQARCGPVAASPRRRQGLYRSWKCMSKLVLSRKSTGGTKDYWWR
mmetsp:Transcript_77793/g.154565  ORF Transcript_77793/g.154565 Transcript_77793/m.154565 type:complete len:201 (-) Transcript_77793:241-843(-)